MFALNNNWSDEEKAVCEKAILYVKNNKQELISRFAKEQLSQTPAISIFMAGSPGAGKTEFSTRLLKEIKDSNKYIVRVDPDEIRALLPMYQIGKAELMQPAVSVAVDKIHDYVLEKNKSFLLDGTLANLTRARENIKRSLKKSRGVRLQFVFQLPQTAWSFTQSRELVEGRNIRREDFIRQFIDSRKNVGILKQEFGGDVIVDLIERNLDNGTYDILFNIDNIDKYIKNRYSESDLDLII